MRKTNSTLVPMGRSSSQVSSKLKITYCLTLFFLFALVANQLNAQCSISCNNVNISVGESCEAEVHWSTLATLPQSCNRMPADSNFTIIVKDLQGNQLASSDTGTVVVDLSQYLDDSVTFEVYYTASGNSNWCWTNALVEDKMPPQIECQNDTIVCLEMFDEPFPTVSDNCTPEEEIDIIVRNRYYVPICNDQFLKLMVREYQARDASGNLSSMCRDTLWFERIDLEDIDQPQNYVNENSLLCQGPWDLNGDEYPNPEETGVPTYQVRELVFNNQDFGTATTEQAPDDIGCGALLTLNRPVTLREFDVYFNLDTIGQVKFLIFEYPSNQKLLETAPVTITDTTEGWFNSPNFDITLPPGKYNIGYVANVSHKVYGDFTANSENGISSQVGVPGNPVFRNFEDPFVIGQGGGDCWMNLYEGMEVFPLYPDQVDACNLQFDYTDREFNIPCGRKVMRTWTGMEWCAGSDRFIEFVQVINIVDTVPPVVEAPVDEIEKSTNFFACEAAVVIPAATVTDNCNEIKRYVVSTNAPGIPVQVFDQPTTTVMNLPIGTWDVIIEAYDNCNQNAAGSDVIEVTVIDNTPPVAVCDEHTVVSLTSDGTARIYAATFDDGSHDECGPIDLMEVRRMNGDCDGLFDNFGPYVEFCCEDIPNSPIMVIFQVTDQAGNTNQCMVEVNVQDKQPAIIEAPDDFTISCEFNFDQNDLSIFGNVEELLDLHDLGVPGADPRDSIFLDDPGDDVDGPVFKGLDGYAYDNCDVTIRMVETIDLNSCGTGTIVRDFYAIGAGNTQQAFDRQIITVIDLDPFDGESIDFPDDITLNNICNDGDELTPEFLRDTQGERYGFPRYTDDECTQLARSYEDWFFPVDDPNDPACYKILRRWKVIDWCTYDQRGSEQPFEHTQVIKVMNTIAPTFDLACNDTTLISIEGDCEDRFVTLVQEATDDCTAKEDLMYSYRIDAFNDGDFDIEGLGNDASDEYPVGTHLIQWTVEDRCGNRNTCSYLFTIESRKGPSPVCRNLTVELMPVDTDGDGSPDEGMLDIWASDFDHKSYHACPNIEVTAISFSADPLDTGRTLTCDSIGTAIFEIWVHASNGTSAFCRTYAIVQANNGVCGPGNEGPTFPIAGNIDNPVSRLAMKDVDVELQGSSAVVSTNENGQYTFDPMPEGGNYTVKPMRDYDLLNGVSTFDILLIQQHILGMQVLTDPYLQIAADINNDEQISGADLIALRKAILGIDNEFPNNTSWRFVDSEYEFRTGNPLSESFPESYVIRNLGAPMTNVNFDGLKIGDLNGNADADVDGRSGSQLNFIAMDATAEAGSIVKMPFTSDNFDAIQGYQFSLNYDGTILDFAGVESGALEINSGNIGDLAERSTLTMSWNDIEGVDVAEGEVLFTLVFEAKQRTQLSSAISMSDEITRSEAYAYNEEIGATLRFNSSDVDEATFALYQNTPNPFTNTTLIGFTIPERSEVTLRVFDVTGKELQVVEGSFEKGYNQIELSRNELNTTGIMYYRIEAGDYTATKKMIVLD